MNGWKRSILQGVIYLLLLALTVPIAACQSPPQVTEQWVPAYLQLHLDAGKAQAQWGGTSESTAIEIQTSIAVEEAGQIVADAREGAQFHTGDGSTLELAPEAIIEVQNPHTFPRLQITARNASFLFVAQELSYEFITPVCPLTLLKVPSRIWIEISGETMRLAVEEGAVACEMGAETLTLLTCQEIYIRPGEELQITEFCPGSTAASPSLPASTTPPAPTASVTPAPSPTQRGFELTATLPYSLAQTLTPTLEGGATATLPYSLTRTLTPTPILVPTFTPTPTPVPPPPEPEPKPKSPTNTPKPEPGPTDTSEPEPGPTDTSEPEPGPTDTSEPPPADTPVPTSRPTVPPSRLTETPSSS